MNRALWILVVALAIVGAIALLAVLGMWLMHVWMMRGEMMMGNGR
jgi:hypothetical protein